METKEARALGDRLVVLINNRQFAHASDLLVPVLAERTPFRLLDGIGTCLGNGSPESVNSLLDLIAAGHTMGGWVVIASALRQQLERDLPGAFERSRGYVIAADVWYATDSIGERVPGPALVWYFESALLRFTIWQGDDNRWVRRMVGVAVHYWAKQAKGEPTLQPQAEALLEMLSPLFSEREIDAIKGVGWGLKTLGRYYPALVADWLIRQTGRPHRALMLQKATLYMPPELRKSVLEKFP